MTRHYIDMLVPRRMVRWRPAAFAVSARLLAGLTMAFPSSARAQLPPAGSVMVVEQVDSHSVQVYTGFVATRLMAFLGAEWDALTGYQEVSATTALHRGGGDWAVAAGARVGFGSNGWYGGVVVLPSLEVGKVFADAVLFVAPSFTSGGSPVYQLSPAEVLVKAAGHLKFGMCANWVSTGAASPQAAIGPALRFNSARWDLTLNASVIGKYAWASMNATWRILI